MEQEASQWRMWISTARFLDRMYMQCRMSFFIFMRDSLATMYSKSYLIIFYLGILCYIYKSLHSFIYILSIRMKKQILYFTWFHPPKKLSMEKSLIYELYHSLWKWHHSNLLICRIYGLGTPTRIFDQVFLMEVFDTFFK